MAQRKSQAENSSDLEQIKADILENNVCPDLAQDATQLVMGHGNPNAGIVFIGEAPGKNEDLQGEPFVGAAGKLLNEMLEQNGISRSDVYITNIVKYRPPNNRDPYPDEKRAFWPYLIRELKVIKPKVVVTLGRHSMEYFLPGKKISQDHGKLYRLKYKFSRDIAGDHGEDAMRGESEQQTESYNEYDEGVEKLSTKQSASNKVENLSLAQDQDFETMIILPLYHPAAALYNSGMRETLFEDFRVLSNFIR